MNMEAPTVNPIKNKFLRFFMMKDVAEDPSKLQEKFGMADIYKHFEMHLLDKLLRYL